MVSALQANGGKALAVQADVSSPPEKSRELYGKTKGSDAMLAQIATVGTLFPHTMIVEMGILPVKNYQTAVFDEAGLAEFNPAFIRGEFHGASSRLSATLAGPARARAATCSPYLEAPGRASWWKSRSTKVWQPGAP